MDSFIGSWGLRLHQEYTFLGTWQELENRMTYLKSANVEQLTNSSYKLRPDISLGTLVMKGSPSIIDGINVTMDITSEYANEQLVTFTTKLRPEHYFITVVLLFLGFLPYLSHNSDHLQDLPGLVLISMALYLWFHLLLRFQERLVINKTVKELQLLQINS